MKNIIFPLFVAVSLSLVFLHITIVEAVNISFEVKEIKLEADGFHVKAHVEVSGLNDPVLGHEPEKQAADHLVVIVDILEPGGTFNVLPEYYSIGEACLKVGDRCLTPEEADGVNCIHLDVWRTTIRSIINPTTNPKPDSFSSDIEFVIPPEHAGKMVRIRATETHIITNSWPFESYWHSIGYQGRLEELRESEPPTEEEPSPSSTSSEVGSLISQTIEKIRDLLAGEEGGKITMGILAVVIIATAASLIKRTSSPSIPPPPPPSPSSPAGKLPLGHELPGVKDVGR